MSVRDCFQWRAVANFARMNGCRYRLAVESGDFATQERNPKASAQLPSERAACDTVARSTRFWPRGDEGTGRAEHLRQVSQLVLGPE